MNEKLERMCAAQIPGDTYRNLVIHPTYSGRTFKHILVPIWLLTYTFGAKVFQVIVNGVTGQIAGQYPKSFWKVFFLVAIIIVVLLILMLASHRCRRQVSWEDVRPETQNTVGGRSLARPLGAAARAREASRAR